MAFGTLKVTGMFGQAASPRLPLALFVMEAEGAVPAAALATVAAAQVVLLGEDQIALFREVVVAVLQPKAPHAFGPLVLVVAVRLHGLFLNTLYTLGTSGAGDGSLGRAKFPSLPCACPVLARYFHDRLCMTRWMDRG